MDGSQLAWCESEKLQKISMVLSRWKVEAVFFYPEVPHGFIHCVNFFATLGEIGVNNLWMGASGLNVFLFL